MLLLHFSVHIDYAVTFYQQSGGDISYTRLLLQHISTHASLVTTSESRPTTMIKYVSSKDNKRTLQVAYVTNERRPRGAIQDQRLKQTFLNRCEVNNNRCTSTNLVFSHPSYCSGWNSSPSQNSDIYAVDGISGDSYKHAVDLGDCGEHVSAISEISIWRPPYNYLADAI